MSVRRRGRPGRTRRAPRLAALLALLLAAAAAIDALWLEPRLLLVRDEVEVPLAGASFRLLHLSDLHVGGEDRPNLTRLLRRAAEEDPDLILVSGDLVADVKDPDGMAAATRATAAYAAELRRQAPVLAVQGHSEYLGSLIAALDGAGVEWLSNEGRRIGPRGAILLLGLNQQVGHDALIAGPELEFGPVTIEGETAYGLENRRGGRNFYASYDPSPSSLASTAGPLSWSGYEATVETIVDTGATGSGLVVHSRYPVGEDRLIRLARASTGGDDRGTFILTFNGTFPAAGELDTGVFPRQGRWYRLKLRTEVAADRMVVRAKAWPAAEPEPAGWQAWAEDRSPLRVEAGTVGLWAWGAGTVGYRNLRVVDEEGAVLLERSLVGGGQPPGFRSGARATRLELARARSPRVPPGTPEIVLVHSPDAVREAAASGIELVLAGHTHGGQVRLPFFGALTTRTRIGREYDRGLFRFPGPGRRGGTWLYVNPGLGTSFLPIRFFDPPAYAVIDLGPREEPPG